MYQLLRLFHFFNVLRCPQTLFYWNKVRGCPGKIPTCKPLYSSQLSTLVGFHVLPHHNSTPAMLSSFTGGEGTLHLDQIASYFPNHMLTTIRGAGHWIHSEARDDVLALLKQYLDWQPNIVALQKEIERCFDLTSVKQ